MANKSFRGDIDAHLAPLVVSPQLRDTILQNAAMAEKPARARRPVKRGALVAVAACMAVVFGLAAAAAVFPGFERFVAGIGSDISAFFSPVQAISVQEGIQLEVVAAYNDEDGAIVYLTLQDLDGARIDENTRLYGISMGDWHFVDSEQVLFEPETGLATYRLHALGGFENVSSARVGLRVETILFGEQDMPLADTGFTLADLQLANPVPAMQPLEISDESYGFSVSYGSDGPGGERLSALLDSGEVPILVPGSLPLRAAGMEWLNISAAGVADGLLHVQLQNRGEADAYNRIQLALDYPGIDREWGGMSSAETGVGYLGSDASGEARYAYQEWFMCLPHALPHEVRLLAGGTIYESSLAGGWAVSFHMEEPEILELEIQQDFGSWTGERLVVSSMGVAIEGRQNPQNADDDFFDFTMQVAVTLADGSQLAEEHMNSGFSGIDFEEGYLVTKHGFATLIPLEDIAAITVNGTVYSLR